MLAETVSVLQPRTATAQEIEAGYDEQIALCYQCKRCTSGCPVADVMDVRPHQVVRLVRLGAADRLLNGEAIWTCVGCYACTTRCPQGVPIAELMYSLKRLALKRNLTTRGAPVPAFLRSFVATVTRHGRNRELPMLARYYLSTDLRVALKESSTGLTLFRQGRLPLLGEGVRGWKAVRSLLRRARPGGGAA